MSKETGMLAGKVAIVTGAGRGIGRALALGLADEGAAVVVNDIGATLAGAATGEDPARDVADEIIARGGRATTSTLSIVDPANAEGIVAKALEAFGRIDVVVNNAGILRDAMFHKMSTQDWRDVIEVHLMGSFNLSRAAASHFREQNGGAFVHMTSTSGLIGNFGQANYMAGKMGIVGLSRSIALDMKRYNVRSNCIAPFAWSRMTSSLPTGTEEERRRVERFQQMTPEKISPLAVWLASDRSAGVSGQIFGVRNNEIYLFSQPRPVASIHLGDGWTPECVDAIAKGAFAARLTPLERSSDVFTWDPV